MPWRGGARTTSHQAIALFAVTFSTAICAAADDRLGSWSAAGYVESYIVGKTESNSPNQRPSGIIDLNLTGSFGQTLRLFADTTSTFGGTPVDPSGGGLIDPRFAFQNLSPALELQEAYADLFFDRLDVRVGMQKFAWGRLDTFNPTDVLNPRRFTDPFIQREADLKVSVPALRASYYPESFAFADTPNITAIWVPVPTSFRFPLQLERWYPPAANVPGELQIPQGFFAPTLPGSTVTTTLETQNSPTPWQLRNGAAALDVGATSSGVDWSIVYYDGPETSPALEFKNAVFSPSAQQKIAEGMMPTVEDLSQLEATATLQPTSGRIHLVGGDLAFSFSGFTARAEVAYGFDRFVPRSTADLISLNNIGAAVRPELIQIIDGLLAGKSVPINLGPLFVRRDVFEWGAGIDYPIGGWVPVLQLNQSVVVDNDLALLVPNVDTRILAALRRSFLGDRLATELVGVQGFERSYTTLQLRATYNFTDHFRVCAGYLFIAGTINSPIGEFGDNDEFFLQARYSF